MTSSVDGVCSLYLPVVMLAECDVLKKVRIQEETLIDCVISVTCTGRQESCGSSKQCTFVSGSCMI